MKLRYLAFSLSVVCSSLGLQAGTIPFILPLPSEEVQTLLQEIEAPLADGFSIDNLFQAAIILESHLTQIENLTPEQKKDLATYLLHEIIDNRSYIPSIEKQILIQIIPALTTILFPVSIDSTLTSPENPSPSEEEILQATNTLLEKLNNKLDWSEIPDCIVYICTFSSSYPQLSPQDKVYIEKRILGEVIDKAETPFFFGAIFDEVLKRIGYALIDCLATRN